MNRTPYMNQNRMANQRMMRTGCAPEPRQNMCDRMEKRSGDCGSGREGQNSREQQDGRRDCEVRSRETEHRMGCGNNEREAQQCMSCGNSERSTKRHPDCSCATRAEASCAEEIPTGSRRELLCFINEVSFAAYDMMLYLDTHPCDMEALEYFRENNRLRRLAVAEYAKRFQPLSLSCTDGCGESTWQWIDEPWPWEGGDC